MNSTAVTTSSFFTYDSLFLSFPQKRSTSFLLDHNILSALLFFQLVPTTHQGHQCLIHPLNTHPITTSYCHSQFFQSPTLIIIPFHTRLYTSHSSTTHLSCFTLLSFYPGCSLFKSEVSCPTHKSHHDS